MQFLMDQYFFIQKLIETLNIVAPIMMTILIIDQNRKLNIGQEKIQSK